VKVAQSSAYALHVDRISDIKLAEDFEEDVIGKVQERTGLHGDHAARSNLTATRLRKLAHSNLACTF
jgi:hypothetical protein